jgi:signal recognition particle receptor subunit beta
MDFGRISISDDVVLYLFGTPGQERFSFMWETLSEGMLGFVLIVDGGNPESVTDAASIIEFFTRMSDVPFVVAANRTAPDDEVSLRNLREELRLAEGVPLLGCDARDKESVKSILLGLLYRILESMG